MRFSVIIPAFNRRELLEKALESVARQCFTDHEVIVVDDGSTDGTARWMQSLGGTVRFFQQQNAGPGSARNFGISHALGEYLAFLDSDDHWFPWSLQTYETVIRQAQRPAFIAGKPLRFRSDTELARAREQPVAFARFDDYLASGDEWRWWGVSSFVMQREAVLACGGFATESINGEDADLALKLGTAPGFVQITEPVTFGYREHATNLTANLDKTVAGAWHKVRMEQAGRYPGDAPRALERWHVLTRHLRPIILACLRTGRRADAWNLYRATFGWHWQLGRWKFLFGCLLQSVIYRSRVIPPEPGPT